MSNNQWKTPDDYFDSIEGKVLEKAGGRRIQRMRIRSWAVAAGLAIGLLAGYGWQLGEDAGCVTFACLLDETNSEELPMDWLLEAAADDDELFELLLDEMPENWNELDFKTF
jgi:hypothetical protein